MISLLTVLLGCTTTTSISLPVCDVELTIAQPEVGVAGDSVVLTGSPLTDTWDTAVYFGSARALVTDIDRDTCGDCDACRETNGCTACGDCDSCDVLCSSDCIETATVEVPAQTSGVVEVLLYNAYGASTPLAFTVDAPEDTGDTSTEDTGDSGNGTDSGADSGATDTADSTADSGK